MKAAIYGRISDEDQSKYSLGAQVEECKAYIEKEKYELGEVYLDDGYSAKSMKRPQLQQMLSDLRKKKFNILVIWRLDRLTRDTLDGLNMVKNEFKPHGVEFASVTEDIDTSTPDGFMMFTIRLSMAQNEREKIAERASLGQIARAQEGKRNSPMRPLGYNMNPGNVLTINEDEAVIVRKIFDLYTSGWGYHRICRQLVEDGVTTSTGKFWEAKRVKDIIQNPTYIGATHYKRKRDPEDKRIIVYDQHEPIISREQFELANRIRQRKAEGVMNWSSHDFPFSTIVKCGDCASSFNAYINGRGTRNYRCRGYYKFPRCPHPHIVEHKLEKIFFDFLATFNYVTDVEQDKKVGTKDADKDIKRLQKLIEDSTTKKKNYTRAMGSGKLDYGMFEELIDEENRKSEQWSKELDMLISSQPTSRLTRKDIMNQLIAMRRRWPDLSAEQQKILLQQIFDVIVIKKSGDTWAIVGCKLSE